MMGLLVFVKQCDWVLNLIDIGVVEGVILVFGGNCLFVFENGYYVEFMLFIYVDNKMIIVQEEIFGLVLVFILFEDDDDVVCIVNESCYGLVGSVNFINIDWVMFVVCWICVGVMFINGVYVYGVDILFGGYKFSGIGCQNGEVGFN